MEPSLSAAERIGRGRNEFARSREQQRLATSRCLLTEVTWPVVRDARQRRNRYHRLRSSAQSSGAGYHMPLSTDTILSTDWP